MRSIEVKDWRKDQTIAAIVRATFPDYRKRSVYVLAATSVTLTDLNWSGGTRSMYRACTIEGQPAGNADRFHRFAPWDRQQVEGLEVPIPKGMIIVRGGTFCGKDSALTLYVNPEDMPKQLARA